MSLSSAIVHLTMCFDERVLSTGSGVFYERDGKFFVVTAWHNVTGRHTETLNYLDDKFSAAPNNIIVAFKFFASGDYHTSMKIILPLYDEETALFYIHPDNWPRVDVVAIPFELNENHPSFGYLDNKRVDFSMPLRSLDGQKPIRTIQDSLAPKSLSQKWWEHASVTDELFIPSYPHNITDYHYNPVWKRATIATEPKSNWNDERKFLIDSASSSGMSGASVFYYRSDGKVKFGGSTHHLNKPAAIHAGIYVGRIGVTDKADPQVGTVWHPSVVDEIIDGGVFDYLDYEVTMNNRDLEAEINQYLTACSPEVIENILDKERATRHYAYNEIMKTIKGRASPLELAELIQQVTSAYKFQMDKDI